MIKDSIVVSRYAEAFINLVKESIGIDKALLDLKKVKSMMRENHEFKEFLESRQIAFVDKSSLIDKLLDKEFSDEIRNFLKLLIDKDRINKALDIFEYIRIKYSYRGEEVLLKTTFPIELGLIKRLENALEKKFQKKFKFYIDLDSSLLGGVQVVVGNKTIDGSVKRRLDDLKEKLMAVQVN